MTLHLNLAKEPIRKQDLHNPPFSFSFFLFGHIAMLVQSLRPALGFECLLISTDSKAPSSPHEMHLAKLHPHHLSRALLILYPFAPLYLFFSLSLILSSRKPSLSDANAISMNLFVGSLETQKITDKRS